MEYTTLASDKVVADTKAAIEKRGMKVAVVENRAEALEWLKNNIAKGAAVMNGSSTTLQEIGFIDYLKSGEHGLNNLGEKILAEKDYAKQSDLRRHATADADVFLASVNAVAETGELIAVDGTGSRVGAFPFVAKKLILVIGTQKIMPTVEVAMKRIREYVRPLEDKRMMGVYGVGTLFGKWIIIEEERMPERIQVLLVKEKLGF